MYGPEDRAAQHYLFQVWNLSNTDNKVILLLYNNPESYCVI